MAKGRGRVPKQTQDDDFAQLAQDLQAETFRQAKKIIEDPNTPIEKKLSLVNKLSGTKSLSTGSRPDPNKVPDVLLAHDYKEPLKVCSNCGHIIEQ